MKILDEENGEDGEELYKSNYNNIYSENLTQEFVNNFCHNY